MTMQCLTNCLIDSKFFPWSAFAANGPAIDIIPAETHAWKDQGKADDNSGHGDAGVQSG